MGMTFVHHILSLLALSLVLILAGTEALKKEDCEVCIVTLQRFEKELNGEDRKDAATIESKFKKFCEGLKQKEERLCYYMGGREDSATGMLKSLSGPLKNFIPVNKVCEKLNKLDSQICELKYEKQIDLKNVNLKKLKVKDLKKILSDWGEDCRGCTEKSEYIRMIEDLMPKYLRDEL